MNNFGIYNEQMNLKTISISSPDKYKEYISKIKEIEYENIIKPELMYCERSKYVVISLPDISTLEDQLIVLYSEDLFNKYDAIVNGIFNCLNYLHSKNIVYGILSPDTLLLKDEKIYFPYVYYNLIDESLYKLDNYYKVMYASPNRLKEGEYDKSDDIWSLGCILYYLFSNKQPFYSEDVTVIVSNIMSCNYKSIKNKEKVPGIIKTIITLCLIEDIDKRIKIDRIVLEYKNKYLPLELDVLINERNNLDLINLYFVEERLNTKRDIVTLIAKSDGDISKLVELYNKEKEDKYFKLLLEVMLSNYNKRQLIIEKTHFDELENTIVNSLYMSHNNVISFDENIRANIDILSFKLSSVLSIKQIGFSRCKLVDNHMIYIAEIISTLPYLETLSIWDNKITSSGLKVLAEQLTSLTNLTTFDVSSNPVGDVGIKILSQYITNCVNLKIFNVGTTGMTNKSFSYLCDSLANLKQINNLNNEIGKEGISSLRYRVSDLTKLTDLKINGNKITDDGINEFSHYLSYLTGLKLLWLHNNEITQQGLYTFTNAMTVLKNLKQLSLANNLINDSGIKMLCKSLRYTTKLEELYLAFNNIQNQGITDLGNTIENLKSLKKLTIEGNKITFAEKNNFLKKYGLIDK